MPTPSILWLFGLPSSGKTTLAHAFREHLQSAGKQAVILDGDELRSGVCSDLTFTDESRSENLRRAAEFAKLLAGQGFHVVCAFITPKEAHRSLVRRILGSSVHLVHIDCPLDICVARDVKGLYKKAADHSMEGLTGAQAGFDPPTDCDLVLHSSMITPLDCISLIQKCIETRSPPQT